MITCNPEAYVYLKYINLFYNIYLQYNFSVFDFLWSVFQPYNKWTSTFPNQFNLQPY